MSIRTLLNKAVLLAVLAICNAAMADDNMLLFSYFKNTDQGGGAYIAASYDGMNWITLNYGQPVLTPNLGDGHGTLMRDPDLSRAPDGSFHMVWTTDWSGQELGHAHSNNILSWPDQNAMGVMEHEPTARNVWAPEALYDPVNENYQIFWSTAMTDRFDNGHRIYKTTTTDFQSFTTPTLFYEPGFTVIDATIIDTGVDGSDRYGMFIKHEADGQKGISMTSGRAISGPFDPNPGPTIVGITVNGLAAEGPTCTKLGDTWHLYWDYYGLNVMGVATSTDLVNWTEKTDQLNMLSGASHGSVLTISKSEFADLIGIAPATSQPMPVHRYTFYGNANDSIGTANGTLVNNTGNATFAGGNLVLGNTGQSSGSDADYVQLPSGIVSELGDSATFEAWVTNTDNSIWQRVFDFGEDNDYDGKYDDAIFLTTHGGSGHGILTGYREGSTDDERQLYNNAPTEIGENGAMIHIALTWDGDTDIATLYVNGIAIDYDTTHFELSSIIDNFNYLGRSRWDADTVFIGEFDEFRIYDVALTDSQVYNSFMAGADEFATAAVSGDANMDGVVDGSDVTILAGNWQTGVNDGQNATWSMGDFNGDGVIDGSDVTILAGNWQHGVTTSATAMPEPSTIALLLTVLTAACLWRMDVWRNSTAKR